MRLEVVTTSGLHVVGTAEEWIAALLQVLTEEQRVKALELVHEKVRLGTVPGQIISVPGIPSAERFGAP